MSKSYLTLSTIVLVLFLCRKGECLPTTGALTPPDPTPGQNGRVCDRKLFESIKTSDPIKQCFKYYFTDENLDIEDALKLIDQMSEPSSDIPCCSFWNFVKCLAQFSAKICNYQENLEWTQFISAKTQYLEQSKCKQIHHDDPKCNQADLLL